MKNTITVKIILGLCGLLILIPGVLALFSPEYFTERNGENISGRLSLLNDYRATGMFMFSSGIIMLLGIIRSKLTFTSVIVAIMAHLGLAIGRWVSLGLDGLPSETLIKASVAETVLGLLALFALIKYRNKGLISKI